MDTSCLWGSFEASVADSAALAMPTAPTFLAFTAAIIEHLALALSLAHTDVGVTRVLILRASDGAMERHGMVRLYLALRGVERVSADAAMQQQAAAAAIASLADAPVSVAVPLLVSVNASTIELRDTAEEEEEADGEDALPIGAIAGSTVAAAVSAALFLWLRNVRKRRAASRAHSPKATSSSTLQAGDDSSAPPLRVVVDDDDDDRIPTAPPLPSGVPYTPASAMVDGQAQPEPSANLTEVNLRLADWAEGWRHFPDGTPRAGSEAPLQGVLGTFHDGQRSERAPGQLPPRMRGTHSAAAATCDVLLKGQAVWYTDTLGKRHAATIEGVHHDEMPPYYTVKGDDVGERQTVRERLTPRGPAADVSAARAEAAEARASDIEAAQFQVAEEIAQLLVAAKERAARAEMERGTARAQLAAERARADRVEVERGTARAQLAAERERAAAERERAARAEEERGIARAQLSAERERAARAEEEGGTARAQLAAERARANEAEVEAAATVAEVVATTAERHRMMQEVLDAGYLSAGSNGDEDEDESECLICLCTMPAREGVQCAEGHFVCDGCFSNMVIASGSDDGLTLRRDNNVYCPMRTEAGGGCGAEAYTHATVAQHASQEATEKWREAERRLAQRRLQPEHDRALEEAERRGAEAERRRMEGTLRDRAQDVRNCITRAIDEATACPHCNAVFMDYDACDAVVCSTCKGHFCGLCLKACDSSDAAHRHIRNCPSKRGRGRVDAYFSNLFEVLKKERIERNVRGILDGLNPELRQYVERILREDLSELGVVI